MLRRNKWKIATAFMLLLTSAFFYPAAAVTPLRFPEGKKFAFTIVDDTDMATLERLRPLYAILEKYGLRTTKTVWVFDSNKPDNSANRGDSLRNPDYRAFIEDLHHKGFEVALHGVRGGDSLRQETLDGLEEFKSLFGAYPQMQVNHSLNRDNLYWGPHLYSTAPIRLAARAAIRYPFDGEDPESPYFWGDAAKQHIKFVRRFTFSEINLYSVVPSMPYHLEGKPYVNYWFPTANGDRIREFSELLKKENIERLEREGGVCIVFAHLGSGSFNLQGGPEADPRFEERIKELASHDGWFAPASEILEFLMKQPSWTGGLSYREMVKLDAKFIAQPFGLN